MILDNLLESSRLSRLLEPLAGVSPTLTLSLEDPTGQLLATAGAPRPRRDRRRRVTRDIPLDGRVIARFVVLAGGPGDDPTAEDEAAFTRLAEGLAEGVGATLELLLAEASGRRAAEHAASVSAAGAAEHEAADGSDDSDGSRLEAELALAHRIQRSLVPLTAPNIPGYEIASHYEAAREVGGDFFDVFKLRGRSSRWAIVIADVTGKGIAAALLMAFARPLLRAAIDHTAAPVEALERTNRILVEERRSALFITALCGIVEIRTGRLRVGNAGHEPPLIVPAGDGPIRWLTGSGPLLGAFRTLDLTECVTELDKGDLVVFYTDGVTDARAVSGERFGDDRLVALVEAHRPKPAAEIVAALSAAVREHQTGMPPADDVTILAIRRLAPGRRRSASTR
jgi:serine phosphatase RsbU (regulator of sigma subunit)